MDIVERLQGAHWTDTSERLRLIPLAIDEIKRLREERDKYRKALQEIAAASKVVAKGEELELVLKVLIASYRETALKALKEKE